MFILVVLLGFMTASGTILASYFANKAVRKFFLTMK